MCFLSCLLRTLVRFCNKIILLGYNQLGTVNNLNIEEEVPIKRKKTQNSKVVINPPKSWFELNVIDKNVQERK